MALSPIGGGRGEKRGGGRPSPPQRQGRGQEFGRHRVSGRLARRSGGAQYLTGAINIVLGDADRDLAEGLNKVTAPGRWVIKRLALWARRVARLNVPRKTGKLRRSIRVDVRKG